MKTNYIISMLLSVMGLTVMGQYSVQTPWGTSVNVTYVAPQDELDLTSRLHWDSIREQQHPDADFQPTWSAYLQYPNLSSTNRFNCHGYAWHMYWFGEDYELDEPYNMTYSEAENYFDDPSFKACIQAEADIWVFNGGTHSAVATDQPSELKSKWDIGPLAVHDFDDHPYTPIVTTVFYKKCLEEVTATYFSDIALNYCAVRFSNTTVSSYVDLEVEYEEGIQITGTFSTGTGATLYFHPD